MVTAARPPARTACVTSRRAGYDGSSARPPRRSEHHGRTFMTTPTHDDNPYGPPAGHGAPPASPAAAGQGAPGTASSIGYAAEPPYATAPKDGLGWAALTVGIVALLLAVFFFPLGFVLAIVGIGRSTRLGTV